jgi:hypothetical protein
MQKVSENTNRTNKARRILASLRNKERACKSKLSKIGLRINILEQFINETRGKKITLGSWLQDKGYDCSKLFPSMGYFTPIGQSVSYDKENRELNYMKGMVRNPAIKGYVPAPNVVGSDYHKAITKSQLGMTFDPALQLYFPTTIYDTELYASAEGSGEDIMDIVENLIELYEEEYDNVEGELDSIYAVQEKLGGGDDYSYADDTKAGRNATCRFGCNFKRKSKRAGCFSDCDKKYPPSQKQEERREKVSDRRTERKENRAERKDARKDKRKAIKDCKAELKAGNISRKELTACKKEQRKIKRDRVKEAGGTFFARVGRGFAKVFPLTASSRGGILVLTKMNAFGFATRIAPALLPEAEAKKKFKPEAIQNGKVAWKKIANAYRNLGGNPDKLKEAILKSYKKKASKVEKQSSADGYTKFVVSSHSNVDPATATLIATGISALVSLIGILVKNKVPKDPYLEGEAPADWTNSKSAVDEAPPIDPNEPQLDPATGKWIDPATGKEIDPLTGAYVGEIFGMNQYLFYGLLGATAIGVILLVRKLAKK